MSKIPTKIISDLERIAIKFGYSDNQLAAKIGIDAEIIPQIFANSYDYVPESHTWIEIENFIARAGMKIYNTVLLKTVTKLLETSYCLKKFAVIISESGAGKTVALEQYALTNVEAIYIRVKEISTKRYVLQDISKALGTEYEHMTAQTMFDCIVDVLKTRIILLMIDEAERLSFSELEMLRDIYDITGIGLVLVGLPKLLELLKKGRNLRENPVQLYSRINYTKVVDILEASDVKMIFADKLNEFKLNISESKYKTLANRLVHKGGLRVTINFCGDKVAPAAMVEKNFKEFPALSKKTIEEDFIDACLGGYLK